MYYLITTDLKLQHLFNNKMYCVLLHPCAKDLFQIYSFGNAKIDWVHIGDYLLNLHFYHDYIGHNNIFIGFGTFLVMPCVNVLFDNEGLTVDHESWCWLYIHNLRHLVATWHVIIITRNSLLVAKVNNTFNQLINDISWNYCYE
jgi:hypothetical protein